MCPEVKFVKEQETGPGRLADEGPFVTSPCTVDYSQGAARTLMMFNNSAQVSSIAAKADEPQGIPKSSARRRQSSDACLLDRLPNTGTLVPRARTQSLRCAEYAGIQRSLSVKQASLCRVRSCNSCDAGRFRHPQLLLHQKRRPLASPLLPWQKQHPTTSKQALRCARRKHLIESPRYASSFQYVRAVQG
jgi:hypothetical protein